MSLLSRFSKRKLNTDENPDQMQDDQLQGNEKRTKWARKIITILVLAILILGFLVVFYVQDIEITGNEYCDAMEIADAVQSDGYSMNSVFVWAKYNLGFGKKPECINTLRVSLKTPWTLSVRVREKEIVGYVLCQGMYGYFDKDGMIVMVSSELIQGMPIIEGVKADSFEKYQKLKVDNEKLFAEILVLSQEIRKFELDIDKIIVHDEELYLMMGNVLVGLGTKISPEQIAQISPILKKLGNQSGILHLENYTEEQKNIVFTKKSKDDINAFLNSSKTLQTKPEKEEQKEEEELTPPAETVPETVPDAELDEQDSEEDTTDDETEYYETMSPEDETGYYDEYGNYVDPAYDPYSGEYQEFEAQDYEETVYEDWTW